MTLANNLRRQRRRAKLTQVELATAAGVPQQTVSRIERGDAVDPRYSTVRAMAEVLDIPTDELVGRNRKTH